MQYMKKTVKMSRKRLICAILSLFLVIQTLSGTGFVSFAEEGEQVSMTEGEIKKGFFSAGEEVTSSDPGIAWVDEEGNLRAMKPGTVTLQAGAKEYEVTVADYTDGSDIVGNLKLLVRYNDSMKFYDGHVCLLFTSYQDGVTIEVPDLYAGYEISDQYYADIREDISNGSYHTGNDPSDYFERSYSMNGVTLNRGEIVTIGMYRDFDLSIKDVAIQTLQNSTLWQKVSAAGKTALVDCFMSLLEDETIPVESVIKDLIVLCTKENLDYKKLLDGVTDGGVCFNRELYNQKLEWDQYENVTYELEITENQLKQLEAGLQGNLDKFSILKNSCATVAARAWNMAVGTRDGEDTSYKLDPSGTGIHAYMDTPKSMRDAVIKNFPGYYLNNSEGVAEPDAGYQDDTGWVYVSAPEKMEFETGPDYSLHLNTVVPYGIETEVKLLDESGAEMDLTESDKLAPGTKVFVTSKVIQSFRGGILSDILLNGKSIRKEENYDAEKDAYFFTMPERESWLKLVFVRISVDGKDFGGIQIALGEEINVEDFATLKTSTGEVLKDVMIWQLAGLGQEDVIEIKEGTDDKVCVAKNTGATTLFAVYKENPYIGAVFAVQVIENREDYATITYDEDETDLKIEFIEDGEKNEILYSGYMIKKGSELLLTPTQDEDKVLSTVKINGKKITAQDKIIVNKDTEIQVAFSKAEITGLPRTVTLKKKGDSYQLKAKVSGLGKLYDTSVRYESSDPLVEVDDSGRITVKGTVPKAGQAVIVTAYAGSSNRKVSASCKVVVGNYAGEKVVGSLTIYARPSVKGQPVPHAAVAFTAYDDIELQASYYHYYKPTNKFNKLITDYDKNPAKYAGDPALYDPDVDLGDRTSYFKTVTHGIRADATTIKVKKGETLTIGSTSFDSHLAALYKTLKGGQFYYFSSEARYLTDQIEKYLNGEEIEGPETFDSLVNSAITLVAMANLAGVDLATGDCDGGLEFNREIYNQFRADISQTPNYYYTVELTADEFAMLQAYTSDPENNYYSLFTKNCTTSAVEAWNAALADRPELQFSAKLTGVAVDPLSLILELKKLGRNVYSGDKAGEDFYPRSHYEIPKDPKDDPKDDPKKDPKDDQGGKKKKKYSNEWVKGVWYNKNGTQTYKGIGTWKKNKTGWWYEDSLGWYPKNRWQKIDGKWYFFDRKGYMEADAYRQGCYLTKSGAWDGKAAVKGWKKDSKGWRYSLANGNYFKKTWKKIDGIWYCFHASGYAACNEFVDGWWLNKDCGNTYPYQSKWKKDSTGWRYGDASGWYAKGKSYTIDRKSYTFDNNGYCTNP